MSRNEESNRRLLRARDEMDRTYADPLDVPSLARIALTSEDHFIRTFRETFGETPHRYLQRRRIERAMFFLRMTDRGITDICFDVGFTSLGTFSRTFRAIVGEAPSAFRLAMPPAPPVPSCFAMAWTRPSGFGEARKKTHRYGRRQRPSHHKGDEWMLKSLSITQIYVLDQQEAIDFYVGKLGLKVVDDIDLGFMRWLTVSVPGENRQILLERPGQPSMDERTAAQVRDLVSKGRAGGNLFFATDDCRKTYAELKAKGVEFSEEPTERPYGIDCALRDPFGNSIRIAQRIA